MFTNISKFSFGRAMEKTARRRNKYCDSTPKVNILVIMQKKFEVFGCKTGSHLMPMMLSKVKNSHMLLLPG